MNNSYRDALFILCIAVIRGRKPSITLRKAFGMKLSARNCLQGKVVAIKHGPVSTEVTIETAAGEKLVSSITSTSAENLGLKVGDTAYAVIKASSVMIAVD